MQSFKSKLIIGLIRNRHLFQGKLKREVVTEDYDYEAFRESISKVSLKRERLPEDIGIERFDINGISAEWLVPRGAPSHKVLMYIHGGGFITGDCDSHRMHMVKFAKATGLRVLQFGYRLAPEYPAQAALDDCLSIYEWLLAQGYKAEDIVVGGESAGGTLTLALLHKIKESGLAYPSRAFSISPITDLRALAPSFEYNKKNDIATYNSWHVWTNWYVGEEDIMSPLVSPQFGDFSGFPPICLCVGSYEVHLDDCKAFAKKAEEAGVSIDFRIWDRMVHAFPIMAPMFKEASEAFDWIVAFIV